MLVNPLNRKLLSSKTLFQDEIDGDAQIGENEMLSIFRIQDFKSKDSTFKNKYNW